MLRSRGYSISTDVGMSDLSASGRMPSGPAALPLFVDLMALMISAFVGGFVFTFNRSAGDGMFSVSGGGALFRISSKRSAHRDLCSVSHVNGVPVLSFTGFPFLPASVRVVS